MCSAKCFLEVHNGGSGNNRIRQVVPVAYDSIAELILCNVTLKLRCLKFKVLHDMVGAPTAHTESTLHGRCVQRPLLKQVLQHFCHRSPVLSIHIKHFCQPHHFCQLLSTQRSPFWSTISTIMSLQSRSLLLSRPSFVNQARPLLSTVILLSSVFMSAMPSHTFR